MFLKVVKIAGIVLALSLQVHSHAVVSPALGVAGKPQRSDVQNPSTASPCGKTNIAANIDTATPVIAAADGTFTVTVTNFNGGRDGSRQVTMAVDATGAGKKFVAGTVSKNGDATPPSTGSQDITASLPSGAKCTGGASGNLCLASFKTLAGFGNCVVVQQGAGKTAASPATPVSSATPPSSTAIQKSAGKAAGDAAKSCPGSKKTASASMNARSYWVSGARAPRAFRAAVEDRGQGDF